MRGAERSERRMQPAFIDAHDLQQLLPVRDAVDALETAFRGSLPHAPQRTRIEVPTGELLLMPSVGISYAGVKLVTVAPDNRSRDRPVVQGAYVLFETETLGPIALIDGTALTTLRTSAVSALATRHLALPNARRLVIFGAGTQGWAHLEAIAAVRDLEAVWVVSRTAERAGALARRAEDLGLRATVAGPEAVEEGEIVCTCTTSPEPVFDGSRLAAGSHVNAVGAYRPDQRELDAETVRRGKVVVETREAALAEAGDLLIPLAGGVIERSHIVADLGEVVRGRTVRDTAEDVTVFKSVGIAFEDLVVAGAAYERSGAGSAT